MNTLRRAESLHRNGHPGAAIRIARMHGWDNIAPETRKVFGNRIVIETSIVTMRAYDLSDRIAWMRYCLFRSQTPVMDGVYIHAMEGTLARYQWMLEQGDSVDRDVLRVDAHTGEGGRSSRRVPPHHADVLTRIRPMTATNIRKLAEVLAEETNRPVEEMSTYARTLVAIGARMLKRAVAATAADWTPRRETNQNRDEGMVRSLAADLGIEAVFNADPRGGFGFYLNLPKSRRSNSFSGNWGV